MNLPLDWSLTGPCRRHVLFGHIMSHVPRAPAQRGPRPDRHCKRLVVALDLVDTRVTLQCYLLSYWLQRLEEEYGVVFVAAKTGQI